MATAETVEPEKSLVEAALKSEDPALLHQAIYGETLGILLAPIKAFLEDPGVTEVLINGYQNVYIEKKGKVQFTGVKFEDEDALLSAARNIAQYVGRTFDEHHPRLDARLPDKSRVHAIMPPLVKQGISIAIRRFSDKRITPDDYLRWGAITPAAMEFLKLCILLEKNLIVSGGTSSGKTTLLNTLSSFIPDHERIIVIEDATELQIQKEHTLQFETRPADSRGRGQVTIRDLFHSSLRMRPDRILIGEIRGGEALDLIQAMTSGHGGSMTTLHANTALDALRRLETMAMMAGLEMPLPAIRRQVVSAINVVVQISRLNDGSRKIVQISEILPLDDHEQYVISDIFRLTETGKDDAGQIQRSLEWTGTTPQMAGEIEIHGLSSEVKELDGVFSLKEHGNDPTE